MNQKENLSEKFRRGLERRWCYVREVEIRDIKDLSKAMLYPLIQDVARFMGDAAPPSVLTLKRWCLRYRVSGGEIQSLLPLPRRNTMGKRRLSAEAIRIMDEVINDPFMYVLRHPAIHAYERMVFQIYKENRNRNVCEKIEVPSLRTFYRQFNKNKEHEIAAKRAKRLSHWRNEGSRK